MISIDVIIPVYRPTEKLKKVLIAIQEQTYRAGKIFLMHTEDGQNLDWTKDVCTKVPVVEVVVQRNEFDHGGTRDSGVQRSEADYVIMMTQDAVPANAVLFEKLINTFAKNQDIAVAYARQCPEKGCGILESYIRKFNYPLESEIKSKNDIEKMGIKAFFCSDVCAAYSREKYLKTGGFEKHIIFNEDMVFAAHAVMQNYKIAYVADAVVIHSHNYSGKQQIKRNFDLGVSQACYPEIFESISSESEGIKMIVKTTGYLFIIKKPFLLMELVVQSGCKYLGYQLGKNYCKLPKRLIMMLTMNPVYWEKEIINGKKAKKT